MLLSKCLGFALVVLTTLGCTQVPKNSTDPTTEPQFTDNNLLIQPQSFREWIYVSSGLGMSYTSTPEPAAPPFTNVFVRPESYRAFVQTGTWPDKTVFVLEVRASSSHGSINQAGHFQADLVGLEAQVKDQGRFPDAWAYFGFRLADGTWTPTADALPNDKCFSCHAQNAASDHTFVQFYPTLLEVAKNKGTLSPNYPH